MQFIKATEADKEYFANLNELAYRTVVERQLGCWDVEKEREKFDAKWREQSFEKVYINGALVGGFWIQEFEEYIQLRELQIHPRFQNQGIGTKTLNILIRKAGDAGKQLRLRVLLENPCVNLYKRLGFRVVGQTNVQYHMVYGPQ